jgi:hypothetical protein
MRIHLHRAEQRGDLADLDRCEARFSDRRIEMCRWVTLLTAACYVVGIPSADAAIDPTQPSIVGWQVSCENVDFDRSCEFFIDVSGTIGADTVGKVQKALAHQPPGWRITVTLNSPGGDIDAAMQIGRIFREARVHTIVKAPGAGPWEQFGAPQPMCASACVLVFAGGVVRGTYGKNSLGIHRPALTVVPQQADMNTVKRATDDAVHRLRAYATEMNISERLIDDMLVIPPENIRWLSDSDRDAYGLSYVDPVFAETIVLDGAKKYGITPAEYRARDKRAKSECKVFTSDEVFGWLDGERAVIVPRPFCLESDEG